MASKRLYLTMTLATLLLATAGCKKDPVKAKLEFVESAEKYMAEEKFSEAIIQYRNALKIDPASAPLQVSLGEAYMRNQQPREAFMTFRKAVELDPKNTKAQMTLAKFYLVGKQLDEVIRITQEVLDREPNNLEAPLLQANAFAGKGDKAQAMKMIDAFVAQHPEKPDGYLYKGMFSLANIEEARGWFEKAVAADPKHLDALKNLAVYYTTKGDYAKAEEYYRTAVNNNPTSVQARTMMIQFYLAPSPDGKKKSQPELAEPLMLEVVKLSKNSDRSRMDLVEFYRMQGKTEQAKGVLDKLSSDSPKFMPAQYALAEIAYEQGRNADAEKIVANVLKDRPTDPMALVLRARSNLERKDAQKAITDLEAALKNDAKIPLLHHLMGLAYEQQGNFERAQASFEEALGINPNYTLAQLALAELMVNKGQPDVALKYTDDILRQRIYAEAYLYKGNAYGQKGDLVKAADAFEKYIEIAPGSPVGYTRLGYTTLLQKKYDLAEKNFKKALEISFKQYDAVNGLAATYLSQKKTAEAEAFLKGLVTQEPTNPNFYMALGSLYVAQKRLPDAEAALTKSHQLDPTNAAPLALLGTAYVSEKQVDKAIGQYEMAVKANPKDGGLLTLYGMLNEQVGKVDIARQSYEKVLDLQPNSPAAANNLAWIMAREGKDLDKALELARRAKVGMPDNPSVNDTLAWIYYKRGLYESAAPLLNDLIKKQPENANYQWHLAAVLAGQGKKDQAKATLSKALKVNPDLRSQNDVKELMSQLSM